MNSLDINVLNEKVSNIYEMGEYFALIANNIPYEATSVIITTGEGCDKYLKGEKEFYSRGVGYCVACDAPLFEELDVAIIGYNKRAEHELKFIKDLAENVYYIPMYDDEVNVDSKVKVVRDNPIEIKGDGLVDTLVLENTTLDVNGVFIIKDTVALDRLIPGIEIEECHVKVDKSMATSIKGCFAAGDITGKPYQYIKSAGEGATATYSAINYLNSL